MNPSMTQPFIFFHSARTVSSPASHLTNKSVACLPKSLTVLKYASFSALLNVENMSAGALPFFLPSGKAA